MTPSNKFPNWSDFSLLVKDYSYMKTSKKVKN